MPQLGLFCVIHTTTLLGFGSPFRRWVFFLFFHTCVTSLWSPPLKVKSRIVTGCENGRPTGDMYHVYDEYDERDEYDTYGVYGEYDK